MEKQKSPKILAIVGCIAVLMSGCSTQNASINKQQLDDSVDKYGFSDPVSIKVGLDYASDFQWVGEESPEDNSWMDLYHENNIYPEIMYKVDVSQKKTKLQSAILSGNYPDIFHTDAANYLSYVNNGVLADITEAYEKYASDELKAYLMSDGGKVLESLKIDGRLYGLPRLGDPYEESSILFIRQDWLDNLGLERPETMEELGEIAYAFTYDDPDGNGIDDTYGIAMDGVDLFSNTFGDANPFFNGFGVYYGMDGMAMVENNDGTASWGGSNLTNVKEALTFLQKMYRDGSLSNDFLTMNSTVVYEEAGAGHCGIWTGPSWAGMIPAINAMSVDQNAHIVALPILNGGSTQVGKGYLANPLVEVHCVSSQCSNPEVLIKLMNLAVQKLCYPSSDEELKKYFGDNENYSGWKASLVHLKPVDGGYQSWKLEQKALSTGKMEELQVQQRQEVDNMKAFLAAKEVGCLDFENPSHTRGIANYTLYGDAQCSWKVLDDMMKENAFVQSVNPVLTSREVIETVETIRNLTVETIIKIITGDSVDEYETFLNTWYSLGGKTAEEAANQILNEISINMEKE